MNTNVGSIDRTLRIVLGIALLSAVFFVEGSLRWLGLIGLVPLLTAAFGLCPIYAMLGINTCAAVHK